MRLLAALFILTSCTLSSDPSLLYERLNMQSPTLESFPHCRSYGCAIIDTVAFNPDEQGEIKKLFLTNNTAAKERENIQKAIATLEIIVGEKTGTSADIGGTYVRLGHLQHDCVDESTNTTTYLILLEKMGLLQFHDVNALTSRPPIFSGRLGPHRTAVIIEKETGQKFAVDSWFHDNGHPPEIVKLDKWKRGWHPAEP